MNPNRYRRASALWLAFACATATAAAPAGESQQNPLPNDPLGLTPYVSTFNVNSSDPLKAYNFRPDRSSAGNFGALRLDNEAPIEFFHGQDTPRANKTIDLDQFDTNAPQTGVDVNLTGFLRHRIDADLAANKAAVIEKQARNTAIDDLLRRYYAQEAGLSDRQLEALNKEHVANEREIKKLRLDAVRSERIIRDNPQLIKKEIAETAEVIRNALFTLMRRCLWEGGKNARQQAFGSIDVTLTTCKGGPAMGMLDSLAEVVDRDKALTDKGPPFSSLKPGALLNISANSDETIYHGNGGFLARLYGIQAFACRSTDDGQTTCEVGTDNHDHQPTRDIVNHEQAMAAQAKAQNVEDDGETIKTITGAAPAVTSQERAPSTPAARALDQVNE